MKLIPIRTLTILTRPLFRRISTLEYSAEYRFFLLTALSQNRERMSKDSGQLGQRGIHSHMWANSFVNKDND